MQSCLQDSLDIFCPASDSGLSARQQNGWLAMCNLPGVEFNVGYCLLSTKRVVFMAMSQLSFISNWLWNMFALYRNFARNVGWLPSEQYTVSIDISIYLNTSKICIGKLLEYHADFVSPMFWCHVFLCVQFWWVVLRLNGMGASVLVIDEVGILSPLKHRVKMESTLWKTNIVHPNRPTGRFGRWFSLFKQGDFQVPC